MENILSLFTQDFFYATMRMASPIILIAIGEVVLQRSGIINLGMESMVILGAFFGVVGSQLTGNGWGGVGTAMLMGSLAGWLYGFFVITLRTNQSVTGIAFNVVGMGLTSFLSRVIWGIRMLPVQVNGIPKWPIPILSEIPYIGPIFFSHTPLVYLAYILVGVATFVLYKTNVGLRIRAIGEDPWAAAAIGINVIRWRYACAMIAGCLASMGGTILSLSQMNMFVEGMSGGRGYFALATVILGQWNPSWHCFGRNSIWGRRSLANASAGLWSANRQSDLLLVFPFLLALIVVIIFHGKASAKPAALGKPYEKEKTI